MSIVMAKLVVQALKPFQNSHPPFSWPEGFVIWVYLEMTGGGGPRGDQRLLEEHSEWGNGLCLL